ncbi:hypothetical protein [Actinomadura oligospora]|uniref:hypothetical protein n=1 Tax=Actinomadura oligospora TaxID=111804 RepID=UPI0004B7E91E|nr:hypothetical protein [Actinomadura oligospora]
MGVRRLPFRLGVGALCLLLAACGSEGKEPEKDSADAVPCTVTVRDIRQTNRAFNGGNHSYLVRFRVHVPGRPDYESSQDPVLDTVQVVKIVAVSKNYSCQVSRSNRNRLRIDWDNPLPASPSPTRK